jgi:DNA-directed RNA polymerase specialized sigma24 family protein
MVSLQRAIGMRRDDVEDCIAAHRFSMPATRSSACNILGRLARRFTGEHHHRPAEANAPVPAIDDELRSDCDAEYIELLKIVGSVDDFPRRVFVLRKVYDWDSPAIATKLKVPVREVDEALVYLVLKIAKLVPTQD